MNFIHHIVLTVSDVEKSAAFYSSALDWQIVEQAHDHACLAPTASAYPESECMLVLGLPRDRQIDGNHFDRNRIGLDHFAFEIQSERELRAVEQRLKTLGIVMEDDGITGDDFGGTAIFCTDPDGMKVEFHLRSRAPNPRAS